jgi:hypothetical protein
MKKSNMENSKIGIWEEQTVGCTQAGENEAEKAAVVTK